MSNNTHFSNGYRYYALTVLVIGYVVNFVDRQILAVLLEPIRKDLFFNDFQLGLLGGLAFAVFYATLGIPIAMLADRKSRVKILAAAMAVWSIMTALCGMASNFFWLLLARIGVGVGEAGASPPSHSLISDYFPVSTRATALSIYSLGIPIGSWIGTTVGGWGADNLGWRMTFFLVGIPGLLVAALVLLTLREPPRGMSDLEEQPKADPTPEPEPVEETQIEAADAHSDAPNWREVFAYLWAKRSFRHLSIAAGLHAFVSYGATNWNPSFLNRIHDMSYTETGYWLGLVYFIGAIGTFLGGFLGDQISDRTGEKRWYFWIPAASLIAMVPLQLWAYLDSDAMTAIAVLFPISILSGMYLGPSFAMTQGLVTLRMRAVAAAILLFVLNLIGMGLGPTLVGVLSDVLMPATGEDSIRYALCASVALNAWSAVHFLIGASTLKQDLADSEELNRRLTAQRGAA
ncbi:MAG: MFS transporter [Pseudomonadota bacterium]|nr:MFS transporter [Pseudomonadota bacterium]